MLVGIDRVACRLNHPNEEQPPALTFPRINKSLHKRCFHDLWAAPAGFRLLSRTLANKPENPVFRTCLVG